MRYIPFLLLFCFFLAACESAPPEEQEDQLPDTTQVSELPEGAPAASEPATARTATIAEPTAPQGLEMLGEATGDLNKDGTDERVVVYNTSREGDLGTERELHVYQNKNSKWVLWQKAAGVVLSSQHGGMMGDPFEQVSVENGSIVISQSGGSRDRWSYTHRFRYQNGGWQLIGATVSFGVPCMEWENFDYNLSTGDIMYAKEKENCDEETENVATIITEKEYTRKPKSLPKMDGFQPGENEVTLEKGVTFYY